MFDLRKKEIDSGAVVDAVEAMVYAVVKPLGFRKFGRTLHRFVGGDISQVIHFQNGCPQQDVHDVLWVNLGIRVPECFERTFAPGKQKRYYHEYECNIRTRLGELADGRDAEYDLREDPEEIGKDVVEKLKLYVLPLYEKVTSRDAVLEYREELCTFDHMDYRRMADLQEAMIYGAVGDTEKAAERFGRYYRSAAEDPVNPGHLRYLEELAQKLGIRLET